MGRRNFTNFFVNKRATLRTEVADYVTFKTNHRNTAINNTEARKDDADSAAAVAISLKEEIEALKDSADTILGQLQAGGLTSAQAEYKRGLLEQLARSAAIKFKSAEEARIEAETKALDAAKFFEETNNSTTAQADKEDADSAKQAAIAALESAANFKSMVDTKLTLAIEEVSDIKRVEDINAIDLNSITGNTFIAGNLRIGDSSSASYPLHVVGHAYASGDVISASDIRLKDEIEAINNAADIITALEGKRYIKDGKPSVGLIAQEVEGVIPEVVHTADDEMALKSVSYGNLVAVLIEAHKELTDRVDILEDEVRRLKYGEDY